MGREVIGHADFVVLEDIHGALTNGGGAGSALIAVLRDDVVVPLCIAREGVELGVGGLGSFVRVARRGGVVRVARRDVVLALVEPLADIRQCLGGDTLLGCHGLRRDGQLAL